MFGRWKKQEEVLTEYKGVFKLSVEQLNICTEETYRNDLSE